MLFKKTEYHLNRDQIWQQNRPRDLTNNQGVMLEHPGTICWSL